MNVELDSEILSPGSTAGFTISLEKDGIPADGEVAVFVVNKAVLDLKDHPVSSYQDVLTERNRAQHVNTVDSRSALAFESGYEPAFGFPNITHTQICDLT